MKLPSALNHTITRVYTAQTRRLHNLRFSFITTPGRIYRLFAGNDEDVKLLASAYEPTPVRQSQWILALCILGTILGIASYIGGILIIGYGLAALQHFDAAALRPRRPEAIDVFIWALVVGVLSGAVTWAMLTTADELDMSVSETVFWIAAALGVLLGSIVVVLIGAVFAIAWWKMATSLWRALYWPAELSNNLQASDRDGVAALG